MKEIEELIEISRKYGKDSRYVIAGGGNTSYKNAEKLWVKASGCALATITEDGFAVLDRKKLNVISEKTYSSDTAAREEEVKNDLAAACITKDRRPSVETSMHNALEANFIVHLHPTMVNGLMCGQNAEAETQKLFGDDAVYIPYTDPGYVLFKEVENRINAYKAKFGKEPAILLLQNHGIFVGANTTKEVEAIYEKVLGTIEKAAGAKLPEGDVPVCECAQEVLPAIRMMLSKQGLKTLKVRNNELTKHFLSSAAEYAKVAAPFSPDAIVYCKSKYLYFDCDSKEALLETAEKEIEAYVNKNGYTPKVILIKGIGLVAVGDNAAGCDIILDVYEDMMKIALIAQAFGGEHPMTQRQIDFIDNWEVENYRRKVSAGGASGRVENKTIIVTGAAQGFGEGIARCLIQQGAKLVTCARDILEEYWGRFPDKLGRAAPLTPEAARARMADSVQAQTREQAAQKADPPADQPEPAPAKDGREIVPRSEQKRRFTDDELALLAALSQGERTADQLVELTQIPAKRVLSALTMLQIQAAVAENPGRRFSALVELEE